jgi:cell division protein FtsB
MRFFITLFLAIIFVFAGVQAYRLKGQRTELLQKDAALTAQASALASEKSRIEADLQYLKSDINLTKELQSKFNYRKPDEKMFMLIPAKKQ